VCVCVSARLVGEPERERETHTHLRLAMIYDDSVLRQLDWIFITLSLDFSLALAL
jgi:hypothetical protein